MSPTKRRTMWIRVGLGLLVLEGLVIGVHALFLPRYFYDHFFLGAAWLPKLGPYSEHLTRDAGALYLGLSLPTLWAIVRPVPDLVKSVALGNALAAFPHMIYHAAHTHQSGTLETIPQAGTLAVTVGLGIWVFLLSHTQERGAVSWSPQDFDPARPGPGATAKRTRSTSDSVR